MIAVPSTRSISSPSYSSSLNLPLVIFPDGSYMEEPSNSEFAEKIGLKTRAQMPFYDLIIIGGGPAGLGSSSIWSLRRSEDIADRKTCTGGTSRYEL